MITPVKQKCGEEGCAKHVVCRGFCQQHYQLRYSRANRHGTNEEREDRRLQNWIAKHEQRCYECNELPKLREAYRCAVTVEARLRLRRLITALEVKHVVPDK